MGTKSIRVEFPTSRYPNACRLVPSSEECLRERYNDVRRCRGLDILQRAGRIEISLRLVRHHEWSAIAETLCGLVVGQMLRRHLRKVIIIWLV